MALDAKSIIKDNSKLILSVLGIIVVTILISANTLNTDRFYNNLTDPNSSNSNSGNSANNTGNATAVSNGKSNIFSSPPAMALEEGTDYYAEIQTSKGKITVDLFEDTAPVNVNNFIFLSRENFYNGSTFHRIMKDYIIQGGDPLGTGRGGPGYYIDDEINTSVRFKSFTVAMANSDRDMNGSQFFITTRSITRRNIEELLEGKYTIIGEVTNGFNVIDNIELERVDSNMMPFNPVMIIGIQIMQNDFR